MAIIQTCHCKACGYAHTPGQVFYTCPVCGAYMKNFFTNKLVMKEFKCPPPPRKKEGDWEWFIS